jgi:hypothetical protein
MHSRRLIALAAGILLPLLCQAQSTFGSIVGNVKDPTGAAVAGAVVTIRNQAENTSKQVWADHEGTYEALNLKPSKYSIKVSHPGFQVSEIEAINLVARQTVRVDIHLQVGAVEQSVTVEAVAGVIASETDTIASSYGTEKILTLPTNLRASTSTSPYFTIQTLPGVQADNSGYLTIQGALPNQSESTIDGISAQNVRDNRPLQEIFPSVENIAEMKVQGIGNNAEYGAAGDITTITKSGTNAFHGTAAAYFQNAALDANTWGSQTKPEKEVNNFSFSAGGPVMIPKIYKGKDKTFFFGDYEQLLYPRTQIISDWVPTDAMKKGDFTKEPGALLDYTTGQPIAGRIIPSTQFSPIAQKLLSTFWPSPNAGDLTVAHNANYIVNKPADINSKQFDVRGDHYLTSKQSVFARFSWKNATSLGPNDLLIPSISNQGQDRSLVASYNYAIRPNIQNEFRLGFTSHSPGGNFTNFDGQAYEKSLGFLGLPPTHWNGLPEIDFSSGLNGIGVDRVEQIELYRTFQFNDNMTWIVGRHTFKFGYDMRFLRTKTALTFNGGDNFGTFNFTGAFSKNDFADFLLGLPAQSAYGNVQLDNDGHAKQYHAYVQDSFRVSQKLTLEYGVRWDYQPPFTDQGYNIGNFNRAIPVTGTVVYPTNPQAAQLLSPGFEMSVNACPATPNLPAVGPGIPGVPCTPFKTASAAGLPEGLRKDYKFNFVPRLGFAYRPFNNGNTVIRAGFGTFWAPVLGAAFYSLTGTSGTDNRTFNNIGTNGQPLAIWPTAHPGGTGVSAGDYGTAYFGTANSIDFKNPLMYQWNFSIDRNIGLNTGLRVTYIGEHSIQLGFAPNLNQSPYSTTFYAQQPLTSRPFPYWGRIESRDSGGTASYQALQVEANRRYKNGLTFTGAYTWAKNLTDTGGPNPSSFGGETGNGRIMDSLNRSENRANDYGTRRHRFIATAVYELPFGKGKAYLNKANGLVDGLLGGWRLSNILLLQTGPYMTPYFNSGVGDPSGTGSGLYRTQRPDRIGSGTLSNPTISNWVDRSAFVCPGQTAGSADQYNCSIGINPASDPAPIGRFGNSGVGILVGPGTVNLSTGLGKTFSIKERLKIKIEGSFTNVFNHTNYADPNLNIASSAFGQITSERGAEFGGHRTGQVGARIEF